MYIYVYNILIYFYIGFKINLYIKLNKSIIYKLIFVNRIVKKNYFVHTFIFDKLKNISTYKYLVSIRFSYTVFLVTV